MKRSLVILVAILIINFFPSVTRQVLIQPFASDMQIYLIGKKNVCWEALVLTSLNAH